jgi:hypothetical protein
MELSMSDVQTTPVDPAHADTAARGLSERTVEETVSSFERAYSTRDIDGFVELFAENGDWRLGPGTFTGKSAIRRVFEWDVQMSPSTRSHE